MSDLRQAEYPVLPFIVSRWSRRAMLPEPVANDELMSLFEAARWAPSSYNCQPWRFIFAHRGSPQWDTMFGLLDELNRQWCINAGVLMILVSRTRYEYNGKQDRSCALNAGAAWENLALQGTSMGLAVRGMQDFDYERARTEFGIPSLYDVQMMIAVGRPGNRESLPERLQGRETPTQRKPVSEIAFENGLPEDYDSAGSMAD
ncbi:MAG: nitroreductase family protein [Nitratireductor sp.]|nr:nitroreductase family protein [Nitratireductor sp.]